MINFKNLTENLIITIVVGALCGAIGYFASTFANEKSNKHYELIMIEAIKKENTKIENNLTNTFKKKSLKKGENIQIIIDPTTNSVISKSDTNQVITVEEEKGFFKRKFWKRKK